MQLNIRSIVTICFPAFCGALLSGPAQSIGYGVFDTRSQSMAGTGVAAASWHSAQYYNPALLALHSVHEDESRDGRFVIPNLVFRADNTVDDIADAASDELDQRLRNAVDVFNVDPTAENAASIAANARELQVLLEDLGNQDITGDVFVGFSVSEPSLLEGGAFYFGTRMLGFASSQIPQEDLALLGDYSAALEAIAAGGDINDLPPDLVDINGSLIDPTDQLNSRADLSGIVISEWAVAMARQFEVFGQALSVGFTPKVLRVDVFRESTDFDTDDLDFMNSQSTSVNLNADLGLALQLFDHYRLGLAVKDVVPEEFTTQNDLHLQLQPRTRFGMAYVNDWVTVGVDVDIGENEPLATEAATQEASFGLEFSLSRSLDVRMGYRQDMTGVRDNVVAGGFAYQWKRAVFELSYAKSSQSTGGGFQLGWVF